MANADVWMLTGTVDTLSDAAQVSPGDLVLKDRGDCLGVGRVVNDRLEVAWIDDVDADLLPDGQLLDAEGRRPGPIQRIDNAPALFSALQRIEEADELRGA